jgi:bifunctional NMN adenylyltransferase/nudix hydrolase
MRDHYDYCVFIARCQPPHKAHLAIIRKALSIATEKVFIILGSHRAAPDVKNPWTTEQRASMISSCLSEEQESRIQFIKVSDHHYNDTIWIAEIQHKVRRAMTDAYGSVAIIGHRKDSSSYYLDFFPNWHFVDPVSSLAAAEDVETLRFGRNLMAATVIRESYFDGTKHWRMLVEEPVAAYLDNFKETDDYRSLVREYDHVKTYKEQWSQTPYPVTFITTDAVVTKAGHILLVRRKFNPGKNLLALPGGFLAQHQTLLDSAIRELREETGIKIADHELKKYVVDSHPFDFPERSLRGRTVTFAFHFKLPDGGDLPGVDGDDDAVEALWMPLGEIHDVADRFFEDHLHIIERFISR